MRYTLLELVQRILESMDSDEVNSVTDTVESLAVAHIVKECYFDIVSNLDLPEKESIFQLTASGDNTKPCVMYLPEDVLDLDNLRYNSNTTVDPTWYKLDFMPFNDFMDMVNNLSTDDDNVGSMTLTDHGRTFTFKYIDDALPKYYTSFNDNTLLFDSYDSDADSTLVGAKTLCQGAMIAEFDIDDDYVAELDPRQFQLLLQAAKAQAFYELKQVENPKAEKKERKNTITAQRTKNAIDRRGGSQTYRGYGRK